MSKFTPGPWTVVRMRLGANEKDRRSGFVVNGPDAEPLPQRVCDMRCDQQKGWTETQANARLIAAAPELLKALEIIAGHTSNAIKRNMTERETSLLDLHSTVIGVQVIARQAIAKAEGGEA